MPISTIPLLKEKYADESHRFRTEIVNLQLKMLVMEMWNIFADKMEQNIKNTEKVALFQRFLQLVEMYCMEHREVEFYAGKLFITPKYLSEICKKSSGKTASEWIQNYTTTRLILLLRNENLTFTQIADSMNFSSQSFFSRFVKKVLSVSPSEYRSRLG
jgi:AraC-like DNA-binding protein